MSNHTQTHIKHPDKLDKGHYRDHNKDESIKDKLNGIVLKVLDLKASTQEERYHDLVEYSMLYNALLLLQEIEND